MVRFGPRIDEHLDLRDPPFKGKINTTTRGDAGDHASSPRLGYVIKGVIAFIVKTLRLARGNQLHWAPSAEAKHKIHVLMLMHRGTCQRKWLRSCVVQLAASPPRPGGASTH